MKGIFQQMREGRVLEWGEEITQQDLEIFKEVVERESKIREDWLKGREENRKALNKKAKELKKQIPFEVTYHCFLAPYRTYVNTEFLEKYKEWL